jgi:hypothetical protein
LSFAPYSSGKLLGFINDAKKHAMDRDPPHLYALASYDTVCLEDLLVGDLFVARWAEKAFETRRTVLVLVEELIDYFGEVFLRQRGCNIC